MLPNFLVVGAAKSATTSLHHYLEQHPEVYMSPVKEPYYFSFMERHPQYAGPHDDRINSQIIYRRADYEALFVGAEGFKARGECSTSYLYMPHAAGNIHQLVPDCRIVAVLRNPVERAFSHYLMHQMLEVEDLPFEEALDASEGRLQANWRWSFDYLGQSLYYESIKRYVDLFGKERVLVFRFDDVNRQPEEVMRRLTEFMEVDPTFDGYEFKVHNRSGKPKTGVLHDFMVQPGILKTVTKPFTSKTLRKKIRQQLRYFLDEKNAYKERPTMNPETRERLTRFFEPDIRKLEALIDLDLSNWYQAPRHVEAVAV